MRIPFSDTSAFTLKITAIVSMTCNHVAFVFANVLPGWLAVALFSFGGITFPIMAFLLTEGYRHTSNVRRYGMRLLVFACIAQVPYSMLWGAVPNVLFTLLAGLAILYARDRIKCLPLFYLALAIITLATLPFDWGFIGPLMVYLFSTLRADGARGITLTMLVPLAALAFPALAGLLDTAQSENWSSLIHALASIQASVEGGAVSANMQAGILSASLGALGFAFEQANPLVYWLGSLGYAIAGFFIATFLLAGYRGRRGPSLKWLFYVYYPLHLTILAIIKIFLN